MKINDYRGILIFAEQRNGEFHRVSFELLNQAKKLADKLKVSVAGVVFGPSGMKVKELIYRGADKIYYIQDEIFNQPDVLVYKNNLLEIIKEIKPEIVLVGATAFGRSLAPRLAAALDTGLTADCTGLEIDSEDQKLIQIRPAFSENILARIKSDTYPQIATIRYKEFPESERDESRQGEIIEKEVYNSKSEGIEILDKVSEREVKITEAEVVVAGGCGIKNPDDFKMLEELASCLEGVVGASRPLVDEGYISKEHQVGYSGNRVKPKLYIACGISGAPQHIAGMKESDVIIVINEDPSAPIFEIADYGIVGDLYEIIPELINKLKNE